MSVVNKMLKDLDERAALEEGVDADYREPVASKRTLYMIVFIGLVGLSAAGYFSYRAMGPQYFVDLYAQVVQLVTGEETQQTQRKKVSVNQALEQMMPSRGVAQSKPATDSDAQVAASQNRAETEKANETQQTLNAQVDDTINNLSENSDAAAIDAPDEGAVSKNAQLAKADTVTSDAEKVAADVAQSGAESDDKQPAFVQVSNSAEAERQIDELTGLAAQAVAENNVAQAISLYQQILNIDYSLHDIRKKLAVLHYSHGNNGAASVILSEGIEIDPQRTDFRLMLARLFYREKKLKAAYTVLEGVDPEVQRNIDFYGLKATVAQELELNAESSHLYGRLVIFEPNRAQWWLGLAISLDRMSQRDGALKAYENAADLRQLSASANDFIRQRILELGG